jgi:hypothetical protein
MAPSDSPDHQREPLEKALTYECWSCMQIFGILLRQSGSPEILTKTRELLAGYVVDFGESSRWDNTESVGTVWGVGEGVCG